MEAIKGYEQAKVIVAKEQLPKGGYKLKVMDAEEVKTDKAHYLKISFDIADGVYIGFYKQDYISQQTEDKRWRGFINVFIPKESDTYYEQNLSRFKTIMADFEQSNNNFHWDWDEKKLKGKMIGGVFGSEEWEYDGKTGMRTVCRYLTNIEAIEQEKYKIPADKLLKGSASAAASPEPKGADFVLTDDDDDLPF